jgi:addiction module RelE/StbE family toxin
MKVIWSPTAERDLDAIWEFIAKDNPDAADRMIERLRTVADVLLDHPQLGRAGRITLTREFVVAGTPYILVYVAGSDEVGIAYVIHGARKWPP